MAADTPHGRESSTEESPDGPAGGAPGRNLPVAIGSGLALAVAFLVALFVEPLVLLAFVAVLAGVALHELDTAMRAKGHRPATPVVGGAGIVMLFGGYLHGPSALAVGLVLAMAGSVVWVLVVERLGVLADAGASEEGQHEDAGGAAAALAAARARVGGDVAASALMTCWVPLLVGFLALLLTHRHGEWFLMATVALTVTSDIGAYAFGTRFGRSKMAPSVSPAKTWEGFAGGLLTVGVIAAVITAQLPGFTLALALALGVSVTLAATVGDLTESLIKRDLGVKDLGRLIPGHGGVMDRVDGILFALPTAHVLLALLGGA